MRHQALWIALMLGPGCVIENWIDDQDDVVLESIEIEEQFFQTPLPKVDVLWIIDDTGSMAQEQARLLGAFEAFVDELESFGLDYQIGVVSTDMQADEAGVLRGNPWIVTRLTPEPVDAFVASADVGTSGVGPEAGLAAMVTALKEPLRSNENRGFRREDASLHVVLLSDADDQSEQWLGSDPASAALSLLVDEADRTGLSARFSAIVGDVPLGCFGAEGAALPGTRYAEVAQASDGVQASICSDDFGPLLGQLGGIAVDYPASFPLLAAPDPETLRVSVNGQRLDEGWALFLEPPTVVFDDAPEAGAQIDVRYQVDGDGS